MAETKVCTKCNQEKSVEEFKLIKKRKKYIPNTRCISCVNEYSRKNYASKKSYAEKRRARVEEYRKNPDYIERMRFHSDKSYRTIKGRAKSLLRSAEKRAVNFGDFDLTLDWVVEKLEKGVCEITGIRFDFEKHPIYDKNPFSPSLDRIDSTKSYTKDNVRIVLWQVNLMRGEMNDEEILALCEAVVRGLNNELQMDMGRGNLP